MLRIRMRRMGKKRQHYFRMVVADQRAKRDGGFLETLGSYNPHADPPAITLNEESAREWIRKGAQPSEAAEKVLRRAGVIEGSGVPRKQVEPAAVAVAEPVKAEEPAPAPVAETPVAAEPEAAGETEPQAAVESEPEAAVETEPQAAVETEPEAAAESEEAAKE